MVLLLDWVLFIQVLGELLFIPYIYILDSPLYAVFHNFLQKLKHICMKYAFIKQFAELPFCLTNY